MNGHKMLIPIITGLLLAYCFGCGKDKQKKSAAKQSGAKVSVSQEPRVKDDMLTLEYDVVGKEDISYAGTPRMEYRIVVRTDVIPSKEQIQETAKSIWEHGDKNWEEFTVFIYLSGMDTGAAAYGIGSFGPSGLRKFEVNEFTLYGTKWRPADQVEKQADQKWEDQKDSPAVKEYSMTLNVEKRTVRQIEIHLQTDFPEGTEILVDVKRIYYQKDEEDEYAGEIFSRDILVKDSRIDLVVDVNDAKWYTEYHKKAEKFKDLGLFSGIDRILPKIEVDALFSPRRQQSASILNKLGKNGEYVKGSGAKRSGSFTTYRVSRSIDIPFEK
jgi:hypothetical protein